MNDRSYLVETPRRSNRWISWSGLVLFLAGFLVSMWYTELRSQRLHDPAAAPRAVEPRGELDPDEKSSVKLFRDHSGSVVFITTASLRINPFSFSFPERVTPQGAGSGIVWDEQGHILTNDHVIADADRAQVTLSDQSAWDARLVGRAPSKDLAVLKIDAPAEILRPVLVGESSNLLVGQKVFAIGNPFGLDRTLTTGIISALDRQIQAREGAGDTRRTIDGVIQTDAAINPGNSGGPLLDSSGRLIGVNTAIYSPSGAYAGVGFAIPVDTVNRVAAELIRHGRIIRPDIGIVPFQDQRMREIGLKGVLVREVEPNSPAMNAGIRPTQLIEYQRGRRTQVHIRFGDLIVTADNEPIEDLDDWFTFLEKHQAGDEVELTIVRDFRTQQEEQIKVRVVLQASN